MNATPSILFVGLGSSHGDDQIGWLVANAISKHLGENTDVQIHKAAQPLDILDWLDGIDYLHICDACHGDEPVGTMFRFETSADTSTQRRILPEVKRLCCSGSHDYGLPTVLDLAERLGNLPERVVVHAVRGQRFRSDDALSDELETALPEVTHTILNELRADCSTVWPRETSPVRCGRGCHEPGAKHCHEIRSNHARSVSGTVIAESG